MLTNISLLWLLLNRAFYKIRWFWKVNFTSVVATMYDGGALARVTGVTIDLTKIGIPAFSIGVITWHSRFEENERGEWN